MRTWFVSYVFIREGSMCFGNTLVKSKALMDIPRLRALEGEIRHKLNVSEDLYILSIQPMDEPSRILTR